MDSQAFPMSSLVGLCTGRAYPVFYGEVCSDELGFDHPSHLAPRQDVPGIDVISIYQQLHVGANPQPNPPWEVEPAVASLHGWPRGLCCLICYMFGTWGLVEMWWPAVC